MKYLEENLIENTLLGNKEEALLNYMALLSTFQDCFSELCKMRSLKNYLVCLNCLLYRSCLEDRAFEEMLLDKRNEFVVEIDKCQHIGALHLLGKEIILFYVNLNIDTYSSTSNPVVNKALAYVHLNFSEDITLEQVANHVHISQGHLSNLFLLHTECSFSNYLNRLRIDTGKKLLTRSDHPLMDIAFMCGFNSQSYFCSMFKKIESMSPLQYRNKNKCV